ncbi:hypothetical protein [Oceanicola sp. D3]|uniref:hypothetical protein n=1 Tax=Oceanicola sp. D3 TaxID=2587163 RepID=UPI00143D4DC0|nr:hypothetical protein [Oceanicola sp. D3]
MTIKIEQQKLLGFRLEAEGSGGLKMGGKGGGAAVGNKVTSPMDMKIGKKGGGGVTLA